MKSTMAGCQREYQLHHCWPPMSI